MSAGHISEGKWDQIKGSVKERWGELTDDDYKQSEGKIDQLAGKIEEKYGHARRDVAEKLDEWTGDRDEDRNN
ncbi:MAG: CsbD family protein [Thermomicrobiales bacterium]